jgi:hypothetical protein
MPNAVKKSNQLSVMDYIKLGGAAIGATAIVFIGIKVYKKIKERTEDRNEGNEFKKQLNSSNVQLSDLELKQIADKIEVALNQADDDETAVYEALKKLKTKDDWLKLNVVFGSRKRKANWPYSDVTGGLVDWLNDALNSYYEIPKVNDILSKIGVTI